MIHVIASVEVKEGRVSDYLGILKGNMANVFKEKGCIEYVPTVDVPSGLPPQQLDKHCVTVVEKWESMDDLKAHLSAPHMLVYYDKVKDMIENVSLKVLESA